MARVLLADDSQEVLVMLSSWLKLKDRHSVDLAEDGRMAMEYLNTYTYDVVVLDWDMPAMEGVDVCREFRKSNHVTPVIMLTGRDTTEDKIIGLDSGADDYLTKPFSAEELSARIRSLLRRQVSPAIERLESAGLVIEPSTHKVSSATGDLSLSPTEFDLLVFFVQHESEIISVEKVVAGVWGTDDEASPALLRTTIKRMRRKLETSLGRCPLENVRGQGYVWTPSAVHEDGDQSGEQS